MSEDHAQARRWRRNSAELGELVARYLMSGLTQTAFYRRHGFNTPVPRLRRMRRFVEPPAPATRWVAVEVAPDEAAAGCLASGAVPAKRVLPHRAGAGI